MLMKQSERQTLTTYHELEIELAALKAFVSEKHNFIQESVEQLKNGRLAKKQKIYEFPQGRKHNRKE